MNISYVTVQGRGLIDECLATAVSLMLDSGLRLSGTVCAPGSAGSGHPCDMDVMVLPDGPRHRISQVLGSGSRGCRLDPGAIETLAAEVEAGLPFSNLLIVNKFGKLESQGRGLRPAIVRALDLGIPVLVGVNGLNLAEFEDFAEGLATRLPAHPPAIFAWAIAVTSGAQEAARVAGAAAPSVASGTQRAL